MPATLYERLGGKAAVDLAVDEFYEKIVADDRINEIWSGVRMGGLKTMMKKFLRKATGGEVDGESGGYDGGNMYESHKHVNKGQFPTQEQYDIVLEHFAGTLQELGVDAQLIGEVAAIVESVRLQILGLHNPADDGSTFMQRCVKGLECYFSGRLGKATIVLIISLTTYYFFCK